ncbi:MAG: uracil-DNA glycosylase [Candidatus Latescibacterota bacterium]
MSGADRSALAAARRCLEDLVAFEGDWFVSPEAPAAPLDPAKGDDELERFRQEICDCTRCALAQSRKRFVFGTGDPHAGILFVGEAPGADEDRQGEPFVGAAGQLLTRIIEAMGFSREQVYICNVLKCRPPGNRDPLPEEVAACESHLKRQVELVAPRLIVALGRVAAQVLLKTAEPMGRLRGSLHRYENVPVIVTYHPAALLRNPEWKRPTWEDIKWARREYDGVEL